MITAIIGLPGTAFAQSVEIETSADSNGASFFGEGVLRIVVIDPDADGGSIETISLKIEADPDGGSGSSENIVVPETNDGSGKFELFLAHVDADEVAAGDLDPANSAGVEGDGTCITNCAPFVTFGPSGDINVQAELYDDVRFEIQADNTEVVVNYEETDAALDLDRISYGTNSFVFISILDQDANLNPTKIDEFTLDPDSDPNDDLLVLEGGSLEEAVSFRETGDNTAVFEGKYRLGQSMLASSESLVLTIFDKANYATTLAAQENDSNNIDEISFTVGNSNGSMEIGDDQSELSWDPIIALDKREYAIGDTVHISITDPDADISSSKMDSIQVMVFSGNNSIHLAALESGLNTGIFECSFELAKETNASSGKIASTDTITISYIDKKPADYFENISAGQNPEKTFDTEIGVQFPAKTGIESTKVTVPTIKASGPIISLSTTVANNNDRLQPFVILFEVRDSDGTTIFLSLQSGSLNPSNSTDIAVTWQAVQKGEFEVRTFVISEIGTKAEVLSPVSMAKFTVN